MRTLLTLGLITLLASPALAAPKPARGNEELKRYCSGDAATFCGDADPGREVQACFKKHMRELSEGCRRAIGAYRKQGGR